MRRNLFSQRVLNDWIIGTDFLRTLWYEVHQQQITSKERSLYSILIYRHNFADLNTSCLRSLTNKGAWLERVWSLQMRKYSC